MDNEFDFKKKIQIYKTGLKLKKCRQTIGKSLQEVSQILEISINYLSEIERGLKVPSDYLIKRIAVFYNIDENHLFESFCKVPKIARDELENNKTLQKTLIEIGNNKSLSDKQKHEIYKQLYEAFVKIMEE